MLTFNRSPFNRTSASESYFNVDIASNINIFTRLNLDIPVPGVFAISTQTAIELTREVSFSTAVETSLKLLSSFLREYELTGIQAETKTQTAAQASYSRTTSVTYKGSFNPGDRILIDTNSQTITINGINALDKLTGEFISLVLGDNVVTYTDDEAQRNILTRITHRDKYLY